MSHGAGSRVHGSVAELTRDSLEWNHRWRELVGTTDCCMEESAEHSIPLPREERCHAAVDGLANHHSYRRVHSVGASNQRRQEL